MRKHTWMGLLGAIVVAAAGVASAQSTAAPQAPPSTQAPGTQPRPTQPPPPPTAQTPPAAPQAGDENRLSVTGCLREGPAGSAAGANATPPAADATAKGGAAEPLSKFVLEGAVPAATDKAASDTRQEAPKTYRLIANDAALLPHVGKKLELSGTLDNQSASGAARPGGASSSETAPKLRVLAGKIVAESCA